MPIPAISDKQWIDNYKKLLTEERLKYKVSARTYIYIEEEEVNIGIKDRKE
jgi:hypothetical protein